MASQRLSSLDRENQISLENIQEQQAKLCCCRTSEISSSDDGETSGHSSMHEESLFGSVQERRGKHTRNIRDEDRRSSLVNTALTEADATDICKHIGRYWRSLGRELKFPTSALDEISDDKSNHSNEDKAHALLIKFIHQHGCDATKGKLAEALFRIGRRDVAEHLIGKEYFTSNTIDQQMFLLKEEGRFHFPDKNGQNVTFFVCRDLANEELHLVRKLVGTGYEESCKTLKEQDTIVDSILKTLDVNGIVEVEKRKNEYKKIKEAEEKLVRLVTGLQEIVNSLENQERNEDKIVVQKQLHEDETLLTKMQMLGSGLVQLTGVVSHLEDPFSLEAQMYNFSIGLSSRLRDLQERLKMLREMASSVTKVPDQVKPEKFHQLLQRSQNLEKQIKMREKHFMKRFQELTLENQKRPRQNKDCAASEPPPRSSGYPVEVTGVRRASTQPVSEADLKSLREQVAPPPPDPMEEDACSSVGECPLK